MIRLAHYTKELDRLAKLELDEEADREFERICAEHIGKPPEMNACLRDNKPKLSDACRKVVESHGG